MSLQKQILLMTEQQKISHEKIDHQLDLKEISEHDILNVLNQAEQQFK